MVDLRIGKHYQMIRKIGSGAFGEIFEAEAQAQQLVEAIKENFSRLKKFSSIPAIYLIWQEPFIGIGEDTFIHQMLKMAGFINVFGDRNRYPEISENEINTSNAEYILLSSEPFPFKEKHKKEFENKFPNKKIVLVDGEMFSWYGSRMKLAAKYFEQLRKEIA